jgi:hypothetical protein
VTAPKSARKRLAKAELLLHLAVVAQGWANDVSDADDKTIPFAEWPADDPLKQLATTYDLTSSDLARICTQLADQLEARAERAGYGESLAKALDEADK